MIISSILGAAAFLAIQADPTRGPRDAYTRCLRAYMEKSVKEKASLDAFTAAFPQQCVEQENAYRAALSSFQKSLRVPAAEIDQIIKDEIDTARDNTKQLFEMHQPST